MFYYGMVSLPMTSIGSKILLGTWNVLGDIEKFSILDYFLLLLVGFAGYGGQWFINLGLQNETAATVSVFIVILWVLCECQFEKLTQFTLMYHLMLMICCIHKTGNLGYFYTNCLDICI